MLKESAKQKGIAEITVIHANRPDKAEEIRKMLSETHPEAEVTISFFGPVIGTHLGEGSLGIGWRNEN